MRKEKNHNISLDSIAAECNVSSMTVSRALRQLPTVSEETRKRVFEAAARLGYLRTTRAGRKAELHESMHARPVQIIAGEGGSGMGRFHSELTLSLVRLLAAKRYECVIRVSDGNYREFTRLLATAAKADVEASLIIGNFTEKERCSLLTALPGAILLDDTGKDVIESVYSSFSFDNTRAGALAVRHLLGTGRRRIALVSGPEDHFFTREIETGYRETLADAGIEPDETLICRTDFTANAAAEAVASLLKRDIPFVAVFTNDEMAGGVYRALLQSGRRIPEDVAVCGCDGLPVGEQLYPQLTTLILDHRQLARQVIDKITNQDLALTPVKVRLLPILKIRESA